MNTIKVLIVGLLLSPIIFTSSLFAQGNPTGSQMKKTKQPIVLTVNGKAAMVIQDADSFQKDYEDFQRLAAKNGSDLRIPLYFEPGFDD